MDETLNDHLTDIADSLTGIDDNMVSIALSLTTIAANLPTAREQMATHLLGCLLNNSSVALSGVPLENFVNDAMRLTVLLQARLIEQGDRP